MKRIILLIVFAGLLTPASLHAQQVYVEAGKAVLDMTVATGMPPGAVTNVGKTWTGIPSDTTGPMANNDKKGSINATLYQKLEVAPLDTNNTGVMSVIGTMTMNWTTAFDACKDALYVGAGWRLPTQKELYMIWIFKQALEDVIVNDLSGMPLSEIIYWSATESSDTYAEGVIFTSGRSYTIQKVVATEASVRCVREL